MRNKEPAQMRPRCRKAMRREPWPRPLLVAGFVFLTGLCACNPVEGWRNLTGASKDEPNPQTTPNTRNLAAGAHTPYPNLATVPPPPSQGLTEAEIKKLTQSLVADRTNAKYTAQSIGAVFKPAAPPPPRSESPQAAKETPNGQPAAQKPAAGATLESSLTLPKIGPLPQPEAERPAPPPPRLPPPPQVAPEAFATALPKPASHLPPLPELAPEAVAMAAPRPAPAVPDIRPLPQGLPPPLHRKATAQEARAPAKPIQLAAVTFPPGVATLSPAVKAQMATVVGRVRKLPGTVRVVAYASGGEGALAELNAFSAALAQGEAVAAALKEAGMPPNRIKVEASPKHLPLGLSRVEILLVR